MCNKKSLTIAVARRINLNDKIIQQINKNIKLKRTKNEACITCFMMWEHILLMKKN